MEIRAPEIDTSIIALDEHRARLDADADARPEQVSAALAHLARKRLLASNTLRRSNASERLAWDDANRWLDELLGQDDLPAWSVDELARLNGILTGTRGAPRTERLYSCGLEYLAPTNIATELRALEAHVTATDRHPLLVAATTYIAVVTIHPFDNGNGRTARLAADRLLLQSGYLPLCFLSPIASHVAQMQTGPTRDPGRCVRLVLSAIMESYATVKDRAA